MKTLITAAILALSAASAQAGYLPVDDQEFYAGTVDSSLVTRSDHQSRTLYREGNYADIVKPSPQSQSGDAIGHADERGSSLCEEGNYEA